ncbi:DUF3857 domain-containing protein [bacterium]|nr:DUF3857 domain-containing protein [bacterium]
MYRHFGSRCLIGMVLTFLVLLTATVLSAQTPDYSEGLLDVEKVLKAAAGITADVYPNADDVLVDDYILEIYEPDGTSVSWDDTFVKVLTEKGRKDNQSLSQYFTLPYSTSEIRLLQVIKPDGRTHPVDVENQSRVMVDPSQMGSNIYNPNQKILQVGVPNLEVGDMVRYVAFRETVKPRVPDTWSDYQVFEYTSPIKHYLYEVHAPKSRPLQSIALKSEIPGTVSHSQEKRGDRIVYRWEVRDVARMYDEPDMPALHTVVQRLLVSTIPDWESISKWYWNLSEPHFKVTPDIEAKVEELIAGAEDRIEKISRIFQWVSQDVRYMGITVEAEAPGYEPHDVAMTFENRHGVCRDKAALLVAMLRTAGYKAYPVIIHVGPKKDEEVPQPYFNHAVSAVENEDGSYILMDSTDENTKELFPAYLSNKSYLVAKPEGDPLRISDTVPAEENMMLIETKASVNAAGVLEGESVLRFMGINDNAYRGFFSRSRPEERRRYMEGVLKRIVAGGTLSGLDVEPADMQDTTVPLTLTMRYRATDVLIAGEEAAMLPVPRVGNRVGIVNFVLGKTGLEKREYPLVTDVACGVRETLDLSLDPSLGKVVALPEYPVLRNDQMVWERSLSQQGQMLHERNEFKITEVEFAPSQYLELKEYLKDIEYNGRKMPILEDGSKAAKKPVRSAAVASVVDEPAADIRYLDDTLEYALKDDRNWITTHTVRKEILTYNGKKDHSELKVDFNPVWETVRLDQGFVTTNGVVKQISSQEMNILDAPWVGSAPRYPAGRTLVASFPSVEIGSVIEYALVREARDRPFYGIRYSFRGEDPITRRTVRISAPDTVDLRFWENDGAEGIVPLKMTDAGDEVGFTEEKRNGGANYSWTAENQKPVRSEDQLPPWWCFNPTLFATTGTWADYGKEVSDALEKAVRDQAQVRGRAAEIIDGLDSPQDKIIAIRDFMATNIRSAGPSLNELPLSTITSADRTLTDRYGNSADRAVLLYALLEGAGFAPDFVLGSWAPKVDDLAKVLLQWPALAVFDSVLVRVSITDGKVYLNDTDQYAALGATPHDGRPGLLLSGKPQLIEIAALAEMGERSETRYEVALESNGDALITRSRFYFGMDFGAKNRQFAEMPPEERNRYYQEAVAAVSQSASAVSDLETDFSAYPGVENFTVRVERLAVRNDGYVYFSLPDSLYNLFGLRADERTNPLYWAGERNGRVSTTVLLPLEFQDVLLAPGRIRWNAPGSDGSVRVRVVESGTEGRAGSLWLVHEVSLEPAVISPSSYGNLLDLNRRLSHPSARTVLLSTGEVDPLTASGGIEP